MEAIVERFRNKYPEWKYFHYKYKITPVFYPRLNIWEFRFWIKNKQDVRFREYYTTNLELI